MKVKVKWKDIMKYTWAPYSFMTDTEQTIELEAEPVEEEKKPLTNLEKWISVWGKFVDQCRVEIAYNFIHYIDSKGVSADEAYEKIVEGK